MARPIAQAPPASPSAGDANVPAAGLYKIPELFGPLGTGIGGQVLAGSIASFVCAYLSVRYLTRYFQTRTLTPFAIYCALVGAASLAWLTLR
jgi:undecaprenyl-diphosphatase